MNYDSFYFLHMPKCDGRRFIDDIVLPLKYSNPDLKMLSQLMGDWDGSGSDHYPHQGWKNSITDKTYTVTILRDPIERAVSNFSFNIINLFKQTFGNSYKINFLKDSFIKYVEQDQSAINCYAKNLLHDLSDLKERHDLFKIKLMYEDDNIKDPKNIELIFNRLKKINLILDTETFNIIDRKLIGEKISEDIGCNKSVFPSGINHKTPFWPQYTNQESKDLYSLLNDDDKDYLKGYFGLDYQIYDAKDLFWNTVR